MGEPERARALSRVSDSSLSPAHRLRIAERYAS